MVPTTMAHDRQNPRLGFFLPDVSIMSARSLFLRPANLSISKAEHKPVAEPKFETGENGI